MERREFLKLGAAAAGAVLSGQAAPGATLDPARPRMIGLPISVRPLAQDDLDRIFGDMRERAGANAVFPFLYSHEAHRGGLPERGYRGGNFAEPHLEYYRGGPFSYADMRAPEFGTVDVLARALPVAQRHGIRIFPFILEDNSRPAAVPAWEPLYEVDHHGRRATGHPGGPCFNNPGYQAFTLSLVEDYARSYPIGGLMWGSERQSGLLNTLAWSQSAGENPARTTCFCEFCQRKGRSQGIAVERARAGFDALEKGVLAARSSKRRPRDGALTGVWRVLLKYPEVLAWGNLWATSRHEFQEAIYRKVKSIDPSLLVGWHAWQNISFSPLQRAEEDLTEMARYSDFIRPAVYNHAGGPRLKSFVKGARESLLGDLSGPEALGFLCRTLGYDHEASYDRIAQTGLSADYVEHETRRAVEAVAAAGASTQIWPGMDIDVPYPSDMVPCTPESVGQAVEAVFRAGAQGIILSRNYEEMKPENLTGAGTALRRLGLI